MKSKPLRCAPLSRVAAPLQGLLLGLARVQVSTGAHCEALECAVKKMVKDSVALGPELTCLLRYTPILDSGLRMRRPEVDLQNHGGMD